MNPRDASASKKSWMDGWDRSCQPRPIPWSPDCDNNHHGDSSAPNVYLWKGGKHISSRRHLFYLQSVKGKGKHTSALGDELA